MSTEIQPHGYLYVLDMPRIHRMLRPIKAKIAAIHLAIKSAPSFGYAPVNTAGNKNDSSSEEEESFQDTARNSKSKQGPRRKKHHPRRGGRRSPLEPTPSDRPTAQLNSNEPTTAANTTSSTTAINGSDILIRRFRSSLVDQFRDVIEKIWWQPFCEDYDLPLNSIPSSVLGLGLEPNSYSLGKLSAFSAGRLIAHFNEDDSARTEKYYNLMPAHMRRFALLEHLVELCLTQIPIGNLIIPLVEVCAKYRADHQALRLLEHLSLLRDKTFQLDYDWAYGLALDISCSGVWIEMISRNNPSVAFSSENFHLFLRQGPLQHRILVMEAFFDKIVNDPTSFDIGSISVSHIKALARLLIEDSLQLTGSNVCVEGDSIETSERLYKVIECMAKCLLNSIPCSSQTSSIGDRIKHKESIVALTMHSLFITVSKSESSDDGEVQEWVRLLKSHSVFDARRLNFDVVILSHWTLTCLNSLVLVLDTVGLYSLSMKLIKRMLDDFRVLDLRTRNRLGCMCDISISSLRSHMRDIEQRRIEAGPDESWKYDDILGDWVEPSPKSKKSVYLIYDDTQSDSDFSETGNIKSAVTRRTKKLFDLEYNPSMYDADPRQLRSNVPRYQETRRDVPRRRCRDTTEQPLANSLPISNVKNDRHRVPRITILDGQPATFNLDDSGEDSAASGNSLEDLRSTHYSENEAHIPNAWHQLSDQNKDCHTSDNSSDENYLYQEYKVNQTNRRSNIRSRTAASSRPTPNSESDSDFECFRPLRNSKNRIAEYRDQFGEDSESESLCRPVRKRGTAQSYTRVPKRLKTSLRSDEESYESSGSADDSDETSDRNENRIGYSLNPHIEESEGYSSEESDIEDDEVNTLRVGSPLPTTIPDELAFWLL